MNERGLCETWDDRRLDRLVDGELNDAERRELLAAFDRHPDGWRRCALAFLEAQSWGQELRGYVHPSRATAGLSGLSSSVSSIPTSMNVAPLHPGPLPRGERGIAVAPSPQSWWNVRNLTLPLAMAASFLAAFGLAMSLRSGGGDQVAVSTTNGDPTTVDHRPIRQPARDGSPALQDSVAADAADDRWSMVNLVVDDKPGRAPRQYQLPVLEGSVDEASLTASADVVPFELRQALEQLGHRVEQRRELLPFELDDGRQMVVPVDQIEITPVAQREFQ